MQYGRKTIKCLKVLKSSASELCCSVDLWLQRYWEQQRGCVCINMFSRSSSAPSGETAAWLQAAAWKEAPVVRNHPSTCDRRRPLADAAALEQAYLLDRDPQDRKYPEDCCYWRHTALGIIWIYCQNYILAYIGGMARGEELVYKYFDQPQDSNIHPWNHVHLCVSLSVNYYFRV